MAVVTGGGRGPGLACAAAVAPQVDRVVPVDGGCVAAVEGAGR